MRTPERMIECAIAAIEALRSQGARVHCMTNSVAQNFTANVLLACGATPSMTVSPDEAPAFASKADALLVNLGMLDADRRAAMPAAMEVAHARGIPVVLDPVMCNLSPSRLAFARQLIEAGPLVLKVNPAESEALGRVPAICRIETGQVDRILAPGFECTIRNGHRLMDRTTAMGCALGALVAALATKAENPETAALAALLWFGVAAEIAGAKAEGPGSFATIFLNALDDLDATTIRERARVE